MIHFEGREPFTAPSDLVRAKLADCGFLARCIPDAEVTAASPGHAAWKMKPKLSFLSGSLETHLTRTASEVDSLAFEILGKGIGASTTVTTALTLLPAGDGTDVSWVADITALNGLLKMVPRGLIQSAAQKVIADVWQSVRAAIEATSPPRPASSG